MVFLIKRYEENSELKFDIGWIIIAGSIGIIGIYLLEGVELIIKKVYSFCLKRKKLYGTFAQFYSNVIKKKEKKKKAKIKESRTSKLLKG